MRILGIDPGYERLGIAVLEPIPKDRGHTVVFSECFKTPPGLPFEERLRIIGDRIKTLIKKYKPELLSIETLFLNTNHKTAMRVAEVRGVIIYEAAAAGLSVFEASPPQIKTATTGYGRASKEEIIKMVKMLVKNTPGHGGKASDDEMDAIAAALTASAYLKG